MGEDRTGDERRTTVAEAAEILGISAEAVRGRIRRGTLPIEREGGSVYVLIDRDRTTTDQSRTTADQSRTTADQSRTTTDQPNDRTDVLIAELQDRVRSLEEANRENRRIIAALTSRIPAIEAPADRAVGEPDHGEPDRPSQIEDPGPPRWTMLLLSLSALGVGSAPLFSFLLNDAGNPTPLANVPYALFVLPFIFGLYRGVWTKRKTEFIEFIELAAEPSDRQEVEPSPGANSINTAGGLETIYALAVATGAALVAVVQSYVVLVLIFGNPLNNPGVLRQIFLPAIFGFIGTFLFFVFAELIGVAIGGRQDRGGRLAPASWWNPQLIFGLVGTIITTVGAVIAAMAGGG